MNDSFEKWWEYEGDRFWTAEREDIKYAYLAGQAAAEQRVKEQTNNLELEKCEHIQTQKRLLELQAKCAKYAEEQAVSSEPVVYVDWATVEFSRGGANGIGQYSYVKRDNYSIPLFTTPPNHREAMEKALKAMEETTPIFYAEAIAALKQALGDK